MRFILQYAITCYSIAYLSMGNRLYKLTYCNYNIVCTYEQDCQIKCFGCEKPISFYKWVTFVIARNIKL